jgi:hypothetical protein
MPHLIEIDSYQLPTGPPQTLRFSSGGGMRTGPHDTPPLVHFSPRLTQPWLIRRDLFDRATTYGAIKSAKGQLVLANADGQLDGLLLNTALDGREVRAYVGREGAPFPSAWTPVGRGMVETTASNGNEIVLALRDRLDLLDLPLLTSLYAGSNVLPNGVEGVMTDIGGKPKPRVYGSVLNVTPYAVNTALRIYQVSDRLCAVSACYDRGVSLAFGGNFADVASLSAATLAPGSYGLCSTASGTYVRLQGAPAGTVTVDASTAETRTASLIQQVVLDAGFSLADVHLGDVAALNALCPASVGVWVDGTRTGLDVINELAGSIGAFVCFDNSNTLRMARLDAPTEPSVLTIRPARVVAPPKLISTADGDRGLPPWQITLAWGRVYTTQTDLAGSVAADHRALVEKPYRIVTLQAPSVRVAHPLAPTLGSQDSPIQTALTNLADAQAEAARRLALYSVGRRMWQVKLRLEPAQQAVIDLGLVVTLVYPRFGMQQGLPFRVAGIESDADSGETTLRLWG